MAGAREGGPDLVVADAVDLLEARAPEWFPHLDASRLTVQQTRRRDRPRALLVQLRLHDGSAEQHVVLKGRRIPARPRAGAGGQARPSLLPGGSLDVEEMSQREFVALQAVHEALAGADARVHGAVRPLALLPGRAAFLMAHVAERTLRQRLMDHSRLHPLRRGPSVVPALEHAGSWLRAYHALRPAVPLERRNAEPAPLVAAFGRYGDFLGRAVRRRAELAAVASEAAEQASAAWQGPFPLVLGHGDFVARNLFASEQGCVTVIDPLARWLVPPYEDLARFVVGMRVLGLQVATRGAAFSRTELDAYEAALLTGYAGDGGPVPVDALRAYQLLVLLDKWSTMVSPAGAAGVRRVARRVQQRWGDDVFLAEARRLLEAGRRA